MDLALRDLDIINNNNLIDNYYKYMLEDYNYLKTRSKYNDRLVDLYNECCNNLNIYKKNKIKQLNILSNLVNFIKSTKINKNNKIDIKNRNRELSNLKKHINNLKNMINIIHNTLHNHL